MADENFGGVVADPILCPNGTYTDKNTTGLVEAANYLHCPAGQKIILAEMVYVRRLADDNLGVFV